MRGTIIINEIARIAASAGGRAYYAGGFVRDHILGISQSKDIDIEIFHLSQQEIINILAEFGEVFLSGHAFPVMKIKGHPEWDFSAPVHPDGSFEEACTRRDFTINSMLMDVLTSEIIDVLHAQNDLKMKLIRPTNTKVFIADPLRAYRACQLAARLDFRLHPDTIELIQNTPLTEIKPERIYAEFSKLLLLARQPSIGLRLMYKTGILERMYPLLFALVGCEQSALHHPEGDVWEHTMLVVDEAARIKEYSKYPLALMFAALLMIPANQSPPG